MKIAIRNSPRWRVVAAMIALTFITWLQPIRAAEPMLAIRQAGGESSLYAVSKIERMSFEGDTVVVVSVGGTSSYAAETITRIEFLWDFSSIENPEDATAVFKALHLFQNQPNPFSPETRIEFDLPHIALQGSKALASEKMLSA